MVFGSGTQFPYGELVALGRRLATSGLRNVELVERNASVQRKAAVTDIRDSEHPVGVRAGAGGHVVGSSTSYPLEPLGVTRTPDSIG